MGLRPLLGFLSALLLFVLLFVALPFGDRDRLRPLALQKCVEFISIYLAKFNHILQRMMAIKKKYITLCILVKKSLNMTINSKD